MANTLKGRKFFIGTETADSNNPKEYESDLTLVQYQAVLWTEVKNVGAIGETGTQTNIVSYDEMSTEVTQKQKGISNAGDPEIECARNGPDKGQQAMRTAANEKRNFAFKMEDDDRPTSGASPKPTTYYYRGLVTGPTRPNGRNEDFNLEVYTLGLNQKEIVAEASAT